MVRRLVAWTCLLAAGGLLALLAHREAARTPREPPREAGPEAAAGGGEDADPPRPGSEGGESPIRGFDVMVRDERGNGVHGASVRVWPLAADGEKYTPADAWKGVEAGPAAPGVYSVPADAVPADARVLVLASAPRFHPVLREVPAEEFRGEGRTGPIVLDLAPCGVLRGAVRESPGTPVPGAAVRVVGAPLVGFLGARREPDLEFEWERTRVGFDRGEAGFRFVSITAYGEADGTFLVPAVPGELDRLYVSAAGYRPAVRSATGLVLDSGSPPDYTFVLVRGWRVECRVEDGATGRGIPEAEVGIPDDPECRARKDGEGGFTFDCVPRGMHRLEVDAADWVAAEVPFEVDGADLRRPLVVRLDRGLSATFRVAGAQGDALTGVRLDLREESRWRPRRYDLDDASCRVTVRGLARGETWTVTAEAGGHAPGRTVLDLRSGPAPTSEVVITLQPVVPMSVRVLDAVTGLPIRDAQVNAVGVEDWDLGAGASEHTDADGRCTVAAFGGSTLIRLIVTLEGDRAPATMTTMRVPESEASPPVEIRVTPRDAPPEGVVCVRGPSGDPVAGAFVAIQGRREWLGDRRTDAEGMARFAGLGGEAVGLFVTDAGGEYLAHRQFLEAGAAAGGGGTAWRVDVTLSPAAGIRVHGKGLPGDAAVGLLRGTTLVREADGYWTVEYPAADALDILRVEPGTYDGVVLWTGHEQFVWRGPIAVGAGERTTVEAAFVREGGRRVTGRVAGGGARSGMAVEFERLPGIRDRVHVSESGAFEIDGLPSSCGELQLVEGAGREVLARKVLEGAGPEDLSVSFVVEENR